MMKICLVSTGYPIAGKPTVSGLYTANQTLARGLVAAGHRVDVITFSGNQDWEDNGVAIHHIPWPNVHYFWGKIPLLGSQTVRSARELETSLALYRAVLRLNAHLKFDIVEGAEDASAFASAVNHDIVTIIRLHGEPYTFLRHTPGMKLSLDYRLCRVVQRISLRRVHHLISPSVAHALEIAREIHRTSDDISVIPHDLSLEWSLGHDPNTQNIVLYVSRLERRKGIIDALRSFRGVLDICPETKLVVIGPYHATVDPKLIDRIIDELHLKENVQFLGGLPQEQVIPWYKRARVFLFPSYYESFGLVALEAMACGLPLVGYRTGAIPEVVQDGCTGLLVEPGDIEGLTQSMIQLICNDETWRAMSVSAEQAVDKYRHSSVVAGTEQVYSKLLAMKRQT